MKPFEKYNFLTGKIYKFVLSQSEICACIFIEIEKYNFSSMIILFSQNSVSVISDFVPETSDVFIILSYFRILVLTTFITNVIYRYDKVLKYLIGWYILNVFFGPSLNLGRLIVNLD
jgi:hypothetical protein